MPDTYLKKILTTIPDLKKKKHEQIYDNFVQAIRAGAFPPGSPVSSIDKMTSLSNASSNPIVRALENLRNDGYLCIRERSITRIADPVPADVQNPHLINREKRRSRTGKPLILDEGLLTGIFKNSFQTQLYHARPIAAKLGLHEADQLLRQAMAQEIKSITGTYIPPQHIVYHRHWYPLLSSLYSKMQSIQPGSLLLQWPGDTALSATAGQLGIPVIYLDDAENGFDMEQLQRICEGQPISAVILYPDGQFPSTVMPGPQLEELVRLQQESGFFIVEMYDQPDYRPDHEIRYPLADLINKERYVCLRLLQQLAPKMDGIAYMASDSSWMPQLLAGGRLMPVPMDVMVLLENVLFSGSIGEVVKKQRRSLDLAKASISMLLKDAGVWRQPGIAPPVGYSFYLRPLQGEFPADVFAQFISHQYRIVDPARYLTQYGPVPGIRFSILNIYKDAHLLDIIHDFQELAVSLIH